MICFILQGRKDLTIHNNLLRCDAAQSLISALDWPPGGQIHDEGPDWPCLGFAWADPALLAQIAATMPPARDSDARGSGIAINPMTAPLWDRLLRFLALLDTPVGIPMVAPMVERELLYCLLQGSQGRLLRHTARPGGALGRVRCAVKWIRDDHDSRLRIEDLCDASGMSRASPHRHFVALTGMSPIQDQKQVLLQEARQLRLSGDKSASDVDYAVGYERAAQFSRR
jgi:AraC-like DNA-binding protein